MKITLTIETAGLQLPVGASYVGDGDTEADEYAAPYSSDIIEQAEEAFLEGGVDASDELYNKIEDAVRDSLTAIDNSVSVDISFDTIEFQDNKEIEIVD